MKIKINKNIKYPLWVKEVLTPYKPQDFDIENVELYLCEKQKTGYISGNDMYEHLKKENILKDCLGLSELEAIKEQGADFFRKHFGGKYVYGWESVVRSQGGSLNVPYVCGGGGWVGMFWSWLGGDWSDRNPAARFASPKILDTETSSDTSSLELRVAKLEQN